MASIYSDVDQIDMWTGGLAEDALPRSHVGRLIHSVLVEHFEALRDGSRFWYQRSFSWRARRNLERTRLSTIIRRNSEVRCGEIPRNVFKVAR